MYDLAHAPPSADAHQSRGRLHPVVSANDLVTVGAVVGHVLAAIHTERDEATAQITPNKAQHQADDPSECPSLVRSGGDNLCLTVGTFSVHWALSELLYHGYSGLSHYYCGLPILCWCGLPIAWLSIWLLRVPSWLPIGLAISLHRRLATRRGVLWLWSLRLVSRIWWGSVRHDVSSNTGENSRQI